MPSSFVRANALAANTRTQVYPKTGVVAAGVTAIVFSGTITNIDAATRLSHQVTLEVMRADGTTYEPVFMEMPVPYGSASDVPKMVLAAGEKLVATAVDVAGANLLSVTFAVVERQ